MNVLTLYRTIRYLRPRQIIARARFQFRRVRIGEIAAPTIASTPGPWADPVPRIAEVLDRQRFRLLNQEIDVGKAGGWNQPERDKLLLYHLHYLDTLNARDSVLDARQAADLIERWILDNPAPDGNGWEPYPLSMRIVNWIKWCVTGNSLSKLATESLFLQSRALAQQIEYHLLANHLLANAKALYFAGLFFDHPEAATWREIGARILRDEVQEQILSDGGHFELSPMYHAIITEDLLDIVNISRAFDDRSLREFDALAAKMLGWLGLMTHPDGQLAYFNDSTLGVASTLAELQAYAQRLNIEYPTEISEGINVLAASGYVRYQHGRAVILIDVGKIGPSYQPGHGHCDLLSFELSLDQERYLVNSGVSTYNANARRLAERATASHNTVSIAEMEQSEIWSAFRVGRRAQPIDVNVGPRHVKAAHDGYRRRRIIHRRHFEFCDERLEIKDVLESSSAQTGVAHFHFHPALAPVLTEDYVGVCGARMTFQNARNIELLDYNYCAGFNKRLPAKKAVVTFEEFLITSIDYENSIHKR